MKVRRNNEVLYKNTAFISHMVQMKVFWRWYSEQVPSLIFISHMVQMKERWKALKGRNASSFISHMVQMKVCMR